MIAIAVLGHGVVGSGIVEVLERNGESIRRKAGTDIYIKKILDVRAFPGLPYSDKFTESFEDILADEEIRVVVEVMGGLSPAYDYVREALASGKCVVTANKELVAAKGAGLVALARKNNRNFLFEASVGGGIPIIRPLHHSLAANEINEIVGILNGTTNFILTKMIREGMDFAQALALAQKQGYAEKDPSADVDGHDTCRKICILASLAFGSHVYPESVHTEGIRAVTVHDIRYAESANCVVKLLGQARRQGGKCFMLVGPALVSKESSLAGVDDVFNGILVRGDVTGDVVFYGKGAGKLPTASAVISDVIGCIGTGDAISTLHWTDSDGKNVVDWREEPGARYIRCKGKGLSGPVTEIFGAAHMLNRSGMPDNETAFLTPALSVLQLGEKLKRLRAAGAEILGSIRVWEH